MADRGARSCGESHSPCDISRNVLSILATCDSSCLGVPTSGCAVRDLLFLLTFLDKAKNTG
jgi:hypothetical protein